MRHTITYYMLNTLRVTLYKEVSAVTTQFSTNVVHMQRDALKHRAPSCFLAGGYEGRAHPPEGGKAVIEAS